MNSNELKKITKAVLKEIYAKPEQGHPLAQIFQNLAKSFKPTHPAFFEISEAKKGVQLLVGNMVLRTKEIFAAAMSKNNEAYEEAGRRFNVNREKLLTLSVYWAQQIFRKFSDAGPEIDHAMMEIKRHLEESAGQGNTIVNSLIQKTDTGKPNLINAFRETEHLKEIFKSLEESFDELFNVAIKRGMGKK